MPNQIDTSLVIKDYKGNEIIKSFEQGGEPAPITIRALIQFALTTPLPDDEKLDYKKKWQLHLLAEKAEQPLVTYSAQDTEIILQRSGKIFTALIFGRLKEVIDPEPVA